jgi:hypothetical protein
MPKSTGLQTSTTPEQSSRGTTRTDLILQIVEVRRELCLEDGEDAVTS